MNGGLLTAKLSTHLNVARRVEQRPRAAVRVADRGGAVAAKQLKRGRVVQVALLGSDQLRGGGRRVCAGIPREGAQEWTGKKVADK